MWAGVWAGVWAGAGAVGELVTSGEKDMLYYWDLGPEGLVGKWSEHGRRARVIYNLETLETKEPKTGF